MLEILSKWWWNIMSEDLGDVIRNGFDTYRHNLKISIPFLLYFIPLVSVMIIPMAILLLNEGFASDGLSTHWFLVFQFVQFLGFLLVISGPIFLAGTVGMAKEATLKGKTSLKTMWAEGKKHYFGVLLAALGLFVIFMIGAFALVIPLAALGENVGPFVIFIFFILLIIFILFAVVLAHFCLVSIVIDNLGAEEGIKRGFRFITSYKRDVILISLLFLAAYIVIDLAVITMIVGKSAINGFDDMNFLELVEDYNLLSIPANFVQVVILYPLFIVMWTRLYMCRTGRLGEEDAETPHPEIPTDQSEDQNKDQKET